MIQTLSSPEAVLPPVLLHELVLGAARRSPQGVALRHQGASWSYADLAAHMGMWATHLREAGLTPGARVGVYADKSLATVAAMLAVSWAGGVLVPINPVLKPQQVGHVLTDCSAWGLLTQRHRAGALQAMRVNWPALRHLHCLEDEPEAPGAVGQHAAGSATLESDLAAIFYTSGSTGMPKGVMVSHRNLLVGAASVASYLGNHAGDVLLAVLPLSFDAGFSQLTTAFLVGAQVVLLNHLMPMDVLVAMRDHAVSGLTAVPPLYAQLARLPWPEGAAHNLRYWANTGGRMPAPLLSRLRELAPQAAPYLMYGLTEAFRSTYLPPQQVTERPDSIGRAIPNAEVLVLRPDGALCEPHEAGELVHRGPLVTLGYWGRPEATAERYRWLELPVVPGGPLRAERVVFSGDRVRRDAEGYIYFVGREDEMIKTSGYRVSPTELEEAVLATGLAREVVAWGVEDDDLGQVIALAIAVPDDGRDDATLQAALMQSLRSSLATYMLPRHVTWVRGELPRNPNGKLDRQHWRAHARI